MALGKLSKAHAVGDYANEIGKVSLTVELTLPSIATRTCKEERESNVPINLHRWAYGKMQGCSTSKHMDGTS